MGNGKGQKLGAQEGGYTSFRPSSRRRAEAARYKGEHHSEKGPGLQEDIGGLKVDALNNRVSKYMRQKLVELQEEIGKLSFTVETLRAPPRPDRVSGQIISEATTELSARSNQQCLVDTDGPLHPATGTRSSEPHKHSRRPISVWAVEQC